MELLEKIAKRAGELAMMKLPELRMIHPDNTDCETTALTPSVRLANKADCIEAILLEEFDDR